MAQSTFSLLCPLNSLPSAVSISSHSPQLLTHFQNFLASSKPSYSLSKLQLSTLQATHGVRLPPIHSTALEEVVETRNEELEFVGIGYVSDVHGLQGEIRVKYTTDFPELRFGKPGKRWLRQQFSGREKVLEVELVAGRGHPGDKSWIVKLSGFDSIDQAKELVGATFLVRESDRPVLEEGEFYSRDLVGMRVILKDTGEAVGTVANIFNTGGNDLLHVMLYSSSKPTESGKQESEVSESGQLVWIPFVEAIVPDIDMKRREMQITPPKGLLQLNIRSDERSKKERRLHEWKERKKFQRRLIAAKKNLCELEQQHIFHGFRYGEKSQRNFLAEQIVSVNSSLLQQALQAVKTPVNDSSKFIHDTISWKSEKSLKISENHLRSLGEAKLEASLKHMEAGYNLISKGKVATVLALNTENQERSSHADFVDSGGGVNSAVFLLETLLSDKQGFIKVEHRASVPLILVSPADAIQPLENLFESREYFGFDSEKVRFIEEEKLPVVSCSEEEQKQNKVLMKTPWEILQSPTGSGGIISRFFSNNILEYHIESGVEYVEICSINRRCLCGNPTFIGFVSSCETVVGILTFEDKKEFKDHFHIVLPMTSMNTLVKHVNKLRFEAVLSSNSHVELVDKEWTDVIPSKPNSYEFRCSIDSLLGACSLNKACLMEVTQ